MPARTWSKSATSTSSKERIARLVQPTYNSLLPNNAVVTAIDPGFNRLMNGWDYAGQSQLYGWAYPTGLGGNVAPIRLHVVGTVIQRFPLQVSLPGNNFATVVAGDNVQFTMSQVTRGSLDMARKGDYAFLMPQQINPKGLVVSQLVLYKSIPYAEFSSATRCAAKSELGSTISSTLSAYRRRILGIVVILRALSSSLTFMAASGFS